MHAPIPAVFSLFFLPLSFFQSVPFFLLLVSYYSLVVGCPHLAFSFLGSFFLGDSLFLSASLRCLPPHPVLLFLPRLPPFYSELIQWDFFLLPLGLHQLFLVCCGHPFRTNHQPIGCHDHYHYSEYVSYTITHFTTKFHFVCSCCIPLPLDSNG